MNTLPHPYQTLRQIAGVADLMERNPMMAEALRGLVADLAIELWQAGQTERRAMDLNEYDPPLWCKGMFLEEVTRAVGVPTVAASDPARDMGRGRTIR